MRTPIAAVAAAVVMFFWGFLFWGFLFQSAPVMLHSEYEGSILDSLSETLPETGVYFLPSGMGAEGLPTSIQIVGPSYRDEKVFQVADALEQVGLWQDYRVKYPRYDSA